MVRERRGSSSVGCRAALGGFAGVDTASAQPAEAEEVQARIYGGMVFSWISISISIRLRSLILSDLIGNKFVCWFGLWFDLDLDLATVVRVRFRETTSSCYFLSNLELFFDSIYFLRLKLLFIMSFAHNV